MQIKINPCILFLFLAFFNLIGNINSAEGSNFSFIQITDTHISEDKTTHDNLNNLLKNIKLKQTEAAFILNTGDITEFGSNEEFANYKTIINSSQLKLHHTMGNHDVRWSNTGKKHFENYLGHLYQSFDYDGVHFILLDSGLLLEQYGHFSSEQLHWLEQDLKRNGTKKPVILSAHHPLFLDKKYVDNENDLLKIIENYNIILYLCGHGHSNRHWKVSGVDFLMTCAAKSNSPGYRIFEVTNNIINIYTHDINSDSTILDFSRSLTKQEKTPLLKINKPSIEKQYDEFLPISIVFSSEDMQKMEYRFNNNNWQTYLYSDQNHSTKININHLCEGLHNISFKISKNNGEYWIYSKSFIINRNRIKLKASFKTQNSILATPLIENNSIYIGSLDKKIYALNSENLTPNWEFATDGPIVTTPAISGDTIFVTSGDGFCYALNKTNGSQIWKVKAGESIFSSPVYSNGSILFGSSDSSIYSVKSKNGKILWKFKTQNYIKARPAIFENKVFAGSWDRFFYCISFQTGKLIWKQEISANRYFPAATSNPLVIENKVIVASHDHTVHCFDCSDGRILWQHKTTQENKPGYSSPTGYNNNIFFGSLSGHIFCLDKNDGAHLWTKSLTDSVYSDLIFDSSPQIINSNIVAGSINGIVYSINMNGQTMNWSYKLSNSYIFSTIVNKENEIFIGSCDGTIYKLLIP